MMKKLFVKKDKWINGVLIIKKESIEQVLNNFVLINDVLENDDSEMIRLAKAASLSVSGTAIYVPVTTTEKIWKKLKNSGKDLKLIATSEHRAEKPVTTMEIALV